MQTAHSDAIAALAARAPKHLFDRETPAPKDGDPTERQLDRACEVHGAYLATGRWSASFRAWNWSGCPACKADTEAAAARKLADERRARLAQEIRLSDMPRRFHDRSFGNFVADAPDKASALRICQGYADAFGEARAKGASLILSGRPGTGKSHLAAAIMHHLIESGRVAQYVTCMDMIRAVRSTWRRDSDKTEAQVLRHFGEEVDLLVLDEVGVQYGTEGEQTVLFDVLDRRYREMLPTIIITNAGKAELKAYVGERVFDRLREIATWVPFSWESYRPLAREAE